MGFGLLGRLCDSFGVWSGKTRVLDLKLPDELPYSVTQVVSMASIDFHIFDFFGLVFACRVTLAMRFPR
jgi:hypothetical protein